MKDQVGVKKVHEEKLTSYAQTLPRLLQEIGAPAYLKRQTCVIIKPNLVNASPPPVTLPAAFTEALVSAIRACSNTRIIVAEGCGDHALETDEIFSIHGYDRLARELDLELVDLNRAELIRLEQPQREVFPEFMLPRILQEGALISAAVLKAHSLAEVTLSMKNMLGCAPPAYYQQGGHWKKSAFHARMHQSIFELNCYRKPDLALIDASVGLADHHLGGPTCNPLPQRLLGGFDPVAVDAAGASLLGLDWRNVEHIRMAHGLLGEAE